MSKETDNDKLQRFTDAVEESLLATSDEDILNEAAEDGIDVTKQAAAIRDLVAGEAARWRQHRLREARAGYDKTVRQTSRAAIPSTAAEQRALLESVIAHGQNLPASVTLAFRDGREISDADVAGFLEDLADLGLLDENGEER